MKLDMLNLVAVPRLPLAKDIEGVGQWRPFGHVPGNGLRLFLFVVLVRMFDQAQQWPKQRAQFDI